MRFRLHPERKSEEVFLCNCDEKNWPNIGWRTRRRGNAAYDDDGREIPGQFPVFVDFYEVHEREIHLVYEEDEKCRSGNTSSMDFRALSEARQLSSILAA